MKEAIERACASVNGQSRLAELIGVSTQSITNWKARGSVPAEHAPDIERVTGGAVRCEDLCPAVNWSVLRQAA